ncbi:hypothetical protein LEY_13 [Paenibacillus phage Ley]|uniref:Uncharacterized protein n=3 Tax=Halcyonevirus C7Cdelta TaxID=2845733 RepID=A0A345ASH0_9CAUD|nr:hypothetical protein [Paenibacillus larvae]YP_010082180.1 hypothetical protein KMD17_gp13 [Paenibacillus phage C7Cdelta]AXF39940.1 hypothetical protein ASH_13 [Paenibacillus phage Ash]AXF40227.1 hypothetical protein LEY_13 [Paenibacillus phage Ley]AXF39774.1 hypothetical protein C7CDELTA_13 [Paenibacillus phage C7Cdelta]MDT2249287.1 hypothetical protein [Paenibacillus larvae]
MLKPDIKPGDILIMKGYKAYEVIDGEAYSYNEGDLTVNEVDEDNQRIGNPQELKIKVSNPVIDVIR